MLSRIGLRNSRVVLSRAASTKPAAAVASTFKSVASPFQQTVGPVSALSTSQVGAKVPFVTLAQALGAKRSFFTTTASPAKDTQPAPVAPELKGYKEDKDNWELIYQGPITNSVRHLKKVRYSRLIALLRHVLITYRILLAGVLT